MTKTLGSRETAIALARYADQRGLSRAPQGFKKVGSGAFRTAFLHKEEGVVYKIGERESNLAESYNARKLRRRSTRRLPFNLHIPYTRTFATPGYYSRTIMQEYAEGGRTTECELFWEEIYETCTCNRGDKCFAIILHKIRDWSDIFDVHGSNVLWVKETDTYWLIDIADD